MASLSGNALSYLFTFKHVQGFFVMTYRFIVLFSYIHVVLGRWDKTGDRSEVNDIK